MRLLALGAAMALIACSTRYYDCRANGVGAEQCHYETRDWRPS